MHAKGAAHPLWIQVQDPTSAEVSHHQHPMLVVEVAWSNQQLTVQYPCCVLELPS